MKGSTVFACLVVLAFLPGRANAENPFSEGFPAMRDSVVTALQAMPSADQMGAADEFVRFTESRFGADSVEASAAWLITAQVSRNFGADMDQALAAADRAVRIAENLDPPHDESLGLALSIRGNILENQSRFEASLEDLQRAVALLDVDEPNARGLGTTLSHLAYLYYRMDDLEAAETTSLRSLAIREQALGPRDWDVAWNLGQLRDIAIARGKYEDALGYAYRSLELRRENTGEVNWWYANDLLRCGGIESTLGRRDKARASYDRVLEILDSIGMSENLLASSCLTHLGNLEYFAGRYDQSLRHHRRSVEVAERAAGPDDPQVAINRTNVGYSCLALHDVAEARAQFTRALEIQTQHSGRRSWAVATVLQGLANVHYMEKDFERSRELLQEADAILEELGIGGTIRVSGNHQLARTLVEAGRATEALPVLERGLALSEELDEDVHFRVALLLERGRARLQLGDPAAALEDLERAATYVRGVPGEYDVGLGSISVQAARAANELGNFDSALAWARRGARAQRIQLESLSHGLPERLLLQSSQSPRCLEQAIDLLNAHAFPDSSREQVYLEVIQSREMLFDEMAQRHVSAPHLRSDADRETFEALVAVREQLAHVVNRMLQDPEDDTDVALVLRQRQRKEDLEQALLDAGYRGESVGIHDAVNVDMLREGLPEDTALISYVHTASRYGAFVLTPRGPVIYLPLAEAALVETAFADWYTEIATGERRQGRSPQQAELAYRQAAARLRDMIWTPIVEHLGEQYERVFVVTTGVLQGLSWRSLPDGESGYWIERTPSVDRLTSERELLTATPEIPRDGSMLALGGFDYGDAELASARGDAGCLPRSGFAFGQLPASGAEVEAVVARWEDAGGTATRLTTGPDLRESRFREIVPGHDVLHLATHAWYVAPSCLTQTDTTDSLATLVSGNPLLLSGVALSGANLDVPTGTGAEDGLLTAEEVCSLDLDGVGLTVLSACQTAAGAQISGQGVYGLARAFRLAGAARVAVSLWPVPDQGTKSYMDGLYAHWIATGEPFARALREHARRLLVERRTAGRSTHPFHWAAFEVLR